MKADQPEILRINGEAGNPRFIVYTVVESISDAKRLSCQISQEPGVIRSEYAAYGVGHFRMWDTTLVNDRTVFELKTQDHELFEFVKTSIEKAGIQFYALEFSCIDDFVYISIVCDIIDQWKMRGIINDCEYTMRNIPARTKTRKSQKENRDSRMAN